MYFCYVHISIDHATYDSSTHITNSDLHFADMIPMECLQLPSRVAVLDSPKAAYSPGQHGT